MIQYNLVFHAVWPREPKHRWNIEHTKHTPYPAFIGNLECVDYVYHGKITVRYMLNYNDTSNYVQ